MELMEDAAAAGWHCRYAEGQKTCEILGGTGGGFGPPLASNTGRPSAHPTGGGVAGSGGFAEGPDVL